MKTIYCIGAGEYSDWYIRYAFESKEKRDNLLKYLADGDCQYYRVHDYDLELDDDKVDVSNMCYYYGVWMRYNGDKGLMKRNSFENNKFIFEAEVDETGGLYTLEFPITEDEFDRGLDYYEGKYDKIWNDLNSKVKYMHEVDGISYDDIEDLLNGETKESE